MVIMPTIALNQLCFHLLAVGRDYTLMPNEVTFGFGTGNNNRQFSIVTVMDDLQVEGTESLTLSGSVATATPPASFVGDPVTIDILDDDSKFTIACSPVTQHLFSNRLWDALLQWTNLQSINFTRVNHEGAVVLKYNVTSSISTQSKSLHYVDGEKYLLKDGSTY